MRKIRQEKVPCQAWWLTPACRVLGSLRQAEFETGYKRLSQGARLPHWGAGLQLLMRASLRKCSLGRRPAGEEGGRELSSSRNQCEASSSQSQEDRKPRARKKKLTTGLAWGLLPGGHEEKRHRYWRSSGGLSWRLWQPLWDVCIARCGEPLRHVYRDRGARLSSQQRRELVGRGQWVA